MPGRVAARSARPSATSTYLSSKSSIPSLNSRASTTSRPSSAVTVPEETEITDLRLEVCNTFADSQRTTSGHRKLVARLRKIQEACCYLPEHKNSSKKRKQKTIFVDNYTEDDFNAEIGRCILRVLGVRKAEPAGDRTVRFIGLFLKFASEKDAALFQAGQESNEETYVVPETPTSRLTFSILSLLLPLLSAREKIVRFRATQVTSHIVNTLDSIDDELYHLIKSGLTKRIRDKEPTIRIQTVMGLGRLAGNEADTAEDDEDSDDMDSTGLLERLLDALQNDTSADVRRSLLLNLPLTPATLPYLLERARDLDGATRRALYARLLPTLGDFRHLSLSMREKLLRWGLRDRDENVRKAAAKLFRERWIEDCVDAKKNPAESGTKEPISAPSTAALLELLERIDVINSGVDTGIALEAMKDFWEGRPDYIEAMSFDGDFWNALTPESVFIVRTFNDFCQLNANNRALCEEKMPEVTRLGFYLQKYTNDLLESIKQSAELGGGEEENVEAEFIVEQLLHIALTLDYSDEVGRRKVSGLLREALAMPDLPEEATRLTVEVLRLVCGVDAAGEQVFCGIVLEAIAEVHDNILPSEQKDKEEDSFVSAQSEQSNDSSVPVGSEKKTVPTLSDEELEQKLMREIMINVKCLHMTQSMLQNVEGNLQQNMHLVNILNNLIIPAVRSHEAPIRERGFVCLGLCALLDRTLAEENFPLFIHCFMKGHETLQITALQILCDMLITHPTLLVNSEDESGLPAFQKQLLKCFAKALKPTAAVDVQSAAATSLSKLLLTSRLDIPTQSLDTLLTSMITSFLDPRTQDNALLRQSLAYFLPVYAHSRLDNCEQMARISTSIIQDVLKAADEYFTLEAEENSDGDVDESASEKKVKNVMNMTVNMLSEWTDGRKVVVLDQGIMYTDTKDETTTIQLLLAGDILERLLATSCHGQEKKALLSLLGKLFVPSNITPGNNHDEDKVVAQKVKDLLDEALSEGIATDASSRNTLVKIKNSVLKIVQGKKEESKSRAQSRSRRTTRAVEPDGDCDETMMSPMKKQLATEDVDEDELLDDDYLMASTAPAARKGKQIDKIGFDAEAEASLMDALNLSETDDDL